MKQLTVKEIYDFCLKLKGMGYDLSTLPVYIGNDDELNGIHCAWCLNKLDVNDKNEDTQWLINVINADTHCNELKDKGVLIS